MGEQLTLRGTLEGHGGWITSIATTAEDPNMILSASRDKVNGIAFLHLKIVLMVVFTIIRPSSYGASHARKETTDMLDARYEDTTISFLML